jgi:hypothetical protein
MLARRVLIHVSTQAWGAGFRNKYGKLRVTPKDNSSVEVYLAKLIKAMIIEDQDMVGVNDSRASTKGVDYIRVIPSISATYTNPNAIALKAEFSKKIFNLAAPIDDPVYLYLVAKYKGSILYDNETRASQKLFRIVAVQYIQSYYSAQRTLGYLVGISPFLKKHLKMTRSRM